MHYFTYDVTVSESSLDPNPPKYFVAHSDDPRFTNSLDDLNEIDANIGNASSVPANTVLANYLDALLSQKEDEIQDRILLIQKRDSELQRLIDEIHRIYSSKRYKVGHMLIGPIESIFSKLRKN